MRKRIGVRRGRCNIAAVERKKGIIFNIKKDQKKPKIIKILIRIGLGIMETNNISNCDERFLQ